MEHVLSHRQKRYEELAVLQKRARQGRPFDVTILDWTISGTIQKDGLSLGKTIRQDSTLAQTALIRLMSHGARRGSIGSRIRLQWLPHQIRSASPITTAHGVIVWVKAGTLNA